MSQGEKVKKVSSSCVKWFQVEKVLSSDEPKMTCFADEAHALLSNIQAQILDSQRAVGQLKVQCQGLDKACTKLQEMETELSAKMGVAAHATLGTSARHSYSQQFSTRTADMGGIFILVFPTIPPPLPRGLHCTTPSHRRQTRFFRLERLRGGKLFFQ